MRLERGVNATRVNQDARHKLFVEGKDNQEIDPIVIKELLHNNGLTAVGVSTMGGCDNVRSAAQALIKEYPSYYFLIDRDDQDQETVDKSWQDFPDLDNYNMLIWHKRELENYFIDPDYIENSSFQKREINIRQRILNECNSRIFLDAANLTLYSISRELRKPLPIRHFRNPDKFRDQNAGELELSGLAVAMNERKISVASLLEQNAVKQRYIEFIQELSGGRIPLQYGSGSWLERMSGKEVFRVIANQCFEVKNAQGQSVVGKDKNKEIAKELARLPLEQQPSDFQGLINLLKSKVDGS
ncbi:MAG: hypothetical protein EA366_06375 [Spirulina sp. DLM2.Bin59]|nr:MAG: hypothetical protein EA366_06375 [Spirulina sp. DLM2.Bin59]